MTDALVFRDVRKRYGRAAPWALDGLSFRVPRGALSGLIGPNGAGKTTAFAVMSGLLVAEEGTVELLGQGPFDPWLFKGRIGVMPQDAELPGRHPARALLVHLARLQGMTAVEAAREAERQLAAVRLDGRADDPIDALSHGMRRRVAVATALLGQPELIILDEPTAGLDPVQARSLRDLLASMRGRTTLVVSSHNLLELERLCDHVVLMERGRCVGEGPISEITAQSERMVWTLGPGTLDLALLAARFPGVRLRQRGAELIVTAPVGADLDALTLRLMATLVEAQVAVRAVQRGESLEESVLGRSSG